MPHEQNSRPMTQLATYQLRKNAVFEYSARDLKEELTSVLCTFANGCKLSPDGFYVFKHIGWTISIETAEKNDTLAVKVSGQRKVSKGLWAMFGAYGLLGLLELIVCPPLGLYLLCMGIGAAGDRKGGACLKIIERALKKLCKKHGMTVVR